MFINKRLTQALCISLLVLSSYAYAESLTLSLNKSSYAAGELLELSVAANADEIGVTEADVYLSVQFPDGAIYYWYALGLEGVNARNEIASLITGWLIQTVPEIKFLAFEVPTGIPSGTYKWYLTLAKAGSDVAQPVNWVANVSATLMLTERNFHDGPYEPEVGAIYGDDDSDDGSGAEGGADKFSSTEESSAPPPPSAPPSPTAISGGSADMAAPGGWIAADGEYAETDAMIMAPEPFPDDSQIIPISGTLTAGGIDDNLNFAAFQGYLNRQQQDDRSLPIIDMSDRVTLSIVDDAGKGVSNASLRVLNSPIDSAPLIDTYVGTDGRFYLFPKFDGVTNSQIDLHLAAPADELGSPNSVLNTTLDLEQLPEDRRLTITLPGVAANLPHSLDVMFVIDTTGSMFDELRYIITELRDIISAVQARHQQIPMRFGLVVYRDIGDEYVVRDFAFTDSLNEMQIQLNEQKARGGGNYPEAMEQALEKAVTAKWSQGNVARILFLVADAPPHDKNLKMMLDPVRIARHKGLRIYPLAASGVGDKAEFMMRYAEVLTQGRYLFLTDDSGVGYSHKEPSVPCYVVTRLDKLIARVIDSELTGQRIEANDEDILRTVGNYDAGICGDSNPPPISSAPLAQVENIRINLLESFPVQVNIIVNGYFRDGCEQIEKINSAQEGNLFKVVINTHSVGDFCTEALVPFEEVISLDVYGLKAGIYTVDVNGVTDTFELSLDNVPR